MMSDGSTDQELRESGMCRYLRSSPRQRERCHRQASHPWWPGLSSGSRDGIRIPSVRGGPRLRHPPHGAIKKGDAMRRQLTAVVSFAFVATSGAVLAHHSFAMFDQENPIELEGVVQEFKFTSPHSFIILAVKQQDGGTQLWSLEGA